MKINDTESDSRPGCDGLSLWKLCGTCVGKCVLRVVSKLEEQLV